MGRTAEPHAFRYKGKGMSFRYKKDWLIDAVWIDEVQDRVTGTFVKKPNIIFNTEATSLAAFFF